MRRFLTAPMYSPLHGLGFCFAAPAVANDHILVGFGIWTVVCLVNLIFVDRADA